ncbi:MAG: DUF3228 family protein [Hyphomicrobiaceae bacterium]|nr:DUF3228 family protein [Hyphomicrobiaceae bacterium]
MTLKQRIDITEFALRNWSAYQGKAKVKGITPEDLVAQCNLLLNSGAELKAGYASFCKHIFLRNSFHAGCAFAKITEQNRHLLNSAYRSRRDGELPVLERWFEGLEIPKAKYIDVILYSHNQLLKEASAFSKEQIVPDCDWGIVGIIGTLEPIEPPIPPITQMRNALGVKEGGSGVPIDEKKYTAAAEFWQHHAVIK